MTPTHPTNSATSGRDSTRTTEDVDEASRVLRRGGLVAFPTETVYGLGADAENPEAVAQVFAVKGRPTSHPLILHLGSFQELGTWAVAIPEEAWELARLFWPGPLTLVLRRSERVPLSVTGGLQTVALRVPAHPSALELLARFGGALAAPSANRFGSVSPTSAAHVIEDLGSQIDLVLDGGACRVGVESTILDVTANPLRVLRPGGVTREALQQALGQPIAVGPAAIPTRVPGSHLSHYAPRARVLLVDAEQLAEQARVLSTRGQRVGVLLPEGTLPPTAPGMQIARVPRDLTEYARTLYGLLRSLDSARCDVILVSLPPLSGLGVAIGDRLRRAAGQG